MKTEWYKGIDPNFEKLANILKMGMGTPSHGYTIAEKGSEIVTAPGVYFPAAKGQVIPLESRQKGGTVSPSSPKDTESTKLGMLESILSKVNPSNMESRQLGGMVLPPESMNIEKTKYDILKAAVSVLKPQGPQKSSSDEKTTGEGKAIPLESRQYGGEVNPGSQNVTLDMLKELMKPTPPPFKEDTSSPVFRSDQEAAYNRQYGITPKSTFPSTPEFPGTPKLPTAGSYGMQPTALKPISEGDALWQRKRAEQGWKDPTQDLWEKMRQDAGVVPIIPRAEGGGGDPAMTDEEYERIFVVLRTHSLNSQSPRSVKL